MNMPSPAVERGGGAPLTGSHPALGLELPEFLGADQRAACAEEDPELWFSFSADAEGVEVAKAICGGCPLLRPCTAWGLTHAVHGIWGGLTEGERAYLQRRHGLPQRVGWSSVRPPVESIDGDVESEER
jgi:WhiB family redox-sensing transcriptional regulator